MSTRVLGVIESKGEGFTSTIYEDIETGRVWFVADADIDADGANGQNGKRPAYTVGNDGSEDLANGGMKIMGGRVVCAHEWARDIVILDDDNEPKVFPGGMIASKTWYRDRSKAMDDPAAYVDAESVRFIVVPPLIVQRTAGIVRGCRARVTWNGVTFDGFTADKGSTRRIGELSICYARDLGMNESPRYGGVTKQSVLYELWPGVAAPGRELQPA